MSNLLILTLTLWFYTPPLFASNKSLTPQQIRFADDVLLVEPMEPAQLSFEKFLYHEERPVDTHDLIRELQKSLAGAIVSGFFAKVKGTSQEIAQLYSSRARTILTKVLFLSANYIRNGEVNEILDLFLGKELPKAMLIELRRRNLSLSKDIEKLSRFIDSESDFYYKDVIDRYADVYDLINEISQPKVAGQGCEAALTNK
jgi:hypothetical protein